MLGAGAWYRAYVVAQPESASCNYSFGHNCVPNAALAALRRQTYSTWRLGCTRFGKDEVYLELRLSTIVRRRFGSSRFPIQCSNKSVHSSEAADGTTSTMTGATREVGIAIRTTVIDELFDRPDRTAADFPPTSSRAVVASINIRCLAGTILDETSSSPEATKTMQQTLTLLKISSPVLSAQHNLHAQKRS